MVITEKRGELRINDAEETNHSWRQLEEETSFQPIKYPQRRQTGKIRETEPVMES